MANQQKSSEQLNEELRDAVFSDPTQILGSNDSDKELSLLVFGETNVGTSQALDIFTNPDDLKILDPGLPGLNGDNKHVNNKKEVS